MNFKILKPLSIITLYLCAFTTKADIGEKVLQSISPLDNEYIQNSEGNYLRLIRISQGCRIEGGFFYTDKHEIYNYYFNQQVLYKATVQTFKYHFRKDEEGSHNAITKVYQDSSAVYKLNDPNMQSEFKYYRSLFPIAALKQCT